MSWLQVAWLSDREAPGGQLDGRAVTAGAVDVAPQRLVEFGQVGACEAARSADGVLAAERHVVHAAQDAAVRRLGEQDLLLPWGTPIKGPSPVPAAAGLVAQLLPGR